MGFISFCFTDFLSAIRVSWAAAALMQKKVRYTKSLLNILQIFRFWCLKTAFFLMSDRTIHTPVFLKHYREPSLVFLRIYQSTTTNMQPTFVFLVRLAKHNLPTQPLKSHISPTVWACELLSSMKPPVSLWAFWFYHVDMELQRAETEINDRQTIFFLILVSRAKTICPAAALSASQELCCWQDSDGDRSLCRFNEWMLQ